MGRWPTEKNGRPVSPYEMGYTIPTAADYEIKRGVNIHHGIWPWSLAVRNSISMTFASAQSNTFPMIPSEHNMGRQNLHKDYDPPKLPSLGQMVSVLEEELAQFGVITCIRHKITCETYQLNAADLSRIVQNGYRAA